MCVIICIRIKVEDKSLLTIRINVLYYEVFLKPASNIMPLYLKAVIFLHNIVNPLYA